MKKSIYILSSGELKREGNTLCFLSERGKRFLPITLVGEMHIFGEMNLNKRLLEFLAENQIPIHFYNYYGFYIGSFYPREFYNAGIITLKQSEHYLDKNKRLVLARKFVEGALRNMLVNMRYYANRGVHLPTEEFLKILGRIGERNSVGQLMADEGNAREIYYSSFNMIIKDKAFTMVKRERRPPSDRLNAMISFGNSLMYATMLSEIYKTHLDPRIGYLHATNSRKFSLTLDVSEIFKPIIVDRTIFSLINRRMMGERSFSKEMEGVFLSGRGKRTFIEEYKKKLNTTVKLAGSHRSVSYRRLIRSSYINLRSTF